MEPAVIIMMLSVFFLLLSITVGLYSLFCGLSAAGDVRRMRNLTALRTGESDDKDKKVPTPLPRLAEAGIEVNGKTWILLLVLLAGAGALIGFMALGLIGIGFALIGPLIAELWVRSRGKSRKARFDEQLARSLPMVAENMRAGSSIERALRSVGENSDDPLKSELLACAGAMQIDGDIVAALDDMAKRTGSKDLVLLQAVQKDKVFVTKVYHSISREHIENYLYRLTYDLMIGVVEEKAAGMTVRPEDKEFIANFYKYAFVGLTLEWVRTGMKDDPAALIERVSTLIHGDITKGLEACRIDK